MTLPYLSSVYLLPSKLKLVKLNLLKTKKADQQYEVVERITTIEDENGEIMQKTNQVYIGFPCVPRWYNSDSLPQMCWCFLACSTVR